VTGDLNLNPLDQLANEQLQREGRLLFHLMTETSMEDLTRFAADLTQQQSRLLFEIATELEDTENALKHAEQLVERLKKHLQQLRGLQKVLSK
jgi:predicted translin family RNA/ssDNA-binding protein